MIGEMVRCSKTCDRCGLHPTLEEYHTVCVELERLRAELDKEFRFRSQSAKLMVQETNQLRARLAQLEAVAEAAQKYHDMCDPDALVALIDALAAAGYALDAGKKEPG